MSRLLVFLLLLVLSCQGDQTDQWKQQILQEVLAQHFRGQQVSAKLLSLVDIESWQKDWEVPPPPPVDSVVLSKKTFARMVEEQTLSQAEAYFLFTQLKSVRNDLQLLPDNHTGLNIVDPDACRNGCYFISTPLITSDSNMVIIAVDFLNGAGSYGYLCLYEKVDKQWIERYRRDRWIS